MRGARNSLAMVCSPVLPCRTFMVALAVTSLYLLPLRVSAQLRLRQYQEPRWATMKLDHLYTGVYAEAYTQTTSVDGGSDSDQSRLFLGPLIGFDLSGSIYHPNLLDYRINVDGSVGWTEDDFNGSIQRTDRRFRFLGSFAADANILRGKPLNGRLFTTYNHSYQDYDFFNRLYVDTLRYGGAVSYTTGPFSVFSTITHVTEDARGNPIPIWSENTIGTVSLTHRRAFGSTSLIGSLNDYTRTDFGVPTSGLDYTVNFSDAENFGARKHWHSTLNLGYNHVESLSMPNDLYNAGLNLRAEHTEDLWSQYNLNVSRNTFGDAENDNLNGSAQLEHQLFDSLTSDLTLRGYRYSASSNGEGQDSWQLGGGPGLRYTKRLSSSSVLSAYENFSYSYTDVQSTGGLIPVIDQRYSFGSPGSGSQIITLRQPNVVTSSIIITDTSGLPPGGYLPGADYLVIVNGQFTLIERPAGSRMPDTVLISYNFYSSPSGDYSTVNNALGLRVDFFDNRWSVYTRFNLSRNSGAEYLVVQDLNIFVIGTEGHWKALRAGAEYEWYDSNFSPYDALRFFQSLMFEPEDRSRLSINFNESFYNYREAGRSDANYTATARYNWAVTSRLGLSVEAGISQRFGEGSDQTLAVFRPQMQYVAGKFSASIGYDLNYDEFLNSQTRIRNLGFIRLRKDF